MESDELKLFITVAEHGQITAAADALHIAQPTLSRRLRRLEDAVGTELFDRHGKRITLNINGEIYLEHARRAKAELDTARRRIADRANPSQGTVRLGFLHSFGVRMIPGLIREFRAVEPRVRFELSQDAAAVIADNVESGNIDIGIVSPRPISGGLAWSLLTNQKLSLTVPLGHALATRHTVDLAEAAAEPFITMHKGYGMRRILEELCAAANFEPHITFETSELFTISGMVSAGLGVAIMPIEQTPLLPEGLVQIPLAGPGATRDVGLIWKSGTALGRPVQAFHQFVIEQFATRR
ncbi:LysR family transcriptional regulator [Hoyosella rhizosphaerae]|uniref:Transcriptional regulator n=1 Tax=Hoyosella rhizosphaerae TaxID=1755582 RepID=A0A916U1J7_9ACTN|nr:LysR family transcriptional regulator [Hoyosella rhizosphaerae]MBN4926785.1 LysR family transcriptional regulator [Hoyosella rhizosphaerae]GGC56468.1 putative transcriptional regulator [Hoyosella rhizosphaerae]